MQNKARICALFFIEKQMKEIGIRLKNIVNISSFVL